MKKIVITGGIGSGKSEVGRILRKKGYCVWDADVFAREVLSSPDIALQIKSIFGEEAFLSTGIMDRDFVRHKIFQNATLKTQLESILHPAIGKHFDEKIKILQSISPHSWVFYEAPVIIEARRVDAFDVCILVTAPHAQRLEWLQKNRSLSSTEALNMMNSQLSDEEKAKYAHLVIENTGDVMQLEAHVERCIKYLEVHISR